MALILPKFCDTFSRLIATASVSSLDPNFDMSNQPVADLLATWLADIGFAVEIMQVKSNPGKVNLIARLGQGSGGLVLSGHTDTVPYDESKWDQDPFLLTEKDNRYYGLGTSDMKCFFPIVFEALKEIDLGKLTKPLIILATCDEECTMAGAKFLADTKCPLGRYALIGEPTGLKPVYMHKGTLSEKIKLIGQSGHSSDPSLGNNALEGMNTVINRLIKWRTELQSRETNSLFKVPVPTLNFGSIHGGDNPNRICGECEMKIEARFLPHMSIDEVRASIRTAIMDAVDGTGLTIEFDRIFPGLPGMETDRQSEIVAQAEKITGKEAGTVAFGTEGPFLNSLGMDTVILGAGDIEVAHQANEYLPMDRIEPMKEIIKQLINHFCNK